MTQFPQFKFDGMLLLCLPENIFVTFILKSYYEFCMHGNIYYI